MDDHGWRYTPRVFGNSEEDKKGAREWKAKGREFIKVLTSSWTLTNYHSTTPSTRGAVDIFPDEYEIVEAIVEIPHCEGLEQWRFWSTTQRPYWQPFKDPTIEQQERYCYRERRWPPEVQRCILRYWERVHHLLTCIWRDRRVYWLDYYNYPSSEEDYDTEPETQSEEEKQG